MRTWLMKCLWVGSLAPLIPSTPPLGVIPKKGQPDKWRLLVDLSYPGGASVNDGIDR